MNKKKSISRRDWLIRVGGLGALGAFAGKLLTSSRGRPSTSLCSRCAVVPWCDAPEAVAARRRGRLHVSQADLADP